VVRLEGRLARDGARELDAMLATLPPGARLDLSNLRSMDSDGERALRRLRAAGVELIDLPPGLAWKLEEDLD
jgi:hypothetical protein